MARRARGRRRWRRGVGEGQRSCADAGSVSRADPDAAAPGTRQRRAGASPRGPVRLGLRANLGQFLLLVGVNALVGGTLGQERTVLPLLGDRVFHITGLTAGLTFIV